MSETITVTKKNEVYLLVDTEPGILLELSDFFTFAVPGAQFTPAFRSKQWDGKIRLLNVFARELYIGLIQYIQAFCDDNGYEFINNCEIEEEDLTTLDEFIENLALQCKDEKITPRDYQLASIKHALSEQRALIVSPTASGKSLVIYALMRWHIAKGRKMLIIVPTTSLVEQLYSDFEDYHNPAMSDWTPNWVTRIYSGKEKVDAPVTISTWQSIYKLPAKWFEQFDVVCGDEAHQFKAKSLTSILHKCTTSRFKVGLTGTLDGTKTHRLVLEGLFGPEYKATTTKKLMNSGELAQLSIRVLTLDYSDAEKKAVKKFTYQEEMDWIVTHEKRNKFIRNLTLDQTGNTLLLFQYVEKHGKILHEMLEERAADARKVFFVHGGVAAKDREAIRAITEKEKDAIIVASYGTFSTGINIRNLNVIIFASPSKSRIRNLQSIGRGLRTTETKVTCKLFDIGDNLAWKTHRNYTLLHLVERVKIYASEGFEYKLITIPFHE